MRKSCSEGKLTMTELSHREGKRVQELSQGDNNDNENKLFKGEDVHDKELSQWKDYNIQELAHGEDDFSYSWDSPLGMVNYEDPHRRDADISAAWLQRQQKRHSTSPAPALGSHTQLSLFLLCYATRTFHGAALVAGRCVNPLNGCHVSLTIWIHYIYKA